MKQTWLVEPEKFEVREVAPPPLEEGQVRVQMRYCGICGSDTAMYLGKHPVYKPPLLLGHEGSGVITEVGRGVAGLAPGDEVTLFPLIGCGRCGHCLAGRPNLCPIGFLGCDAPGMLSEEVVVPAHLVRKLPAGVDLEAGSMTEPAAVAVHAARRPGSLQGRSVAVFGAGPIGLLVAQAARAFGAGYVYLIDVLADRLELGRQLGVDAVIQADQQDPAQAVRETFELGVDVCFECSGHPQAALSAIDTSREGGDVVLVGIVKGELPITMVKVQRTERTLIGCQRSLMEDFEEALRFIQEGKMQVKPLISQVRPVADTQQAFEDVVNQRAGVKTVLAF